MKKNVSPAPSIERSSGAMEVFPHPSLTSDLNPVVERQEDIRGVHGKGVETAKMNCCGLSCRKEMDKGWPENVSDNKLGSHLEAQNTYKVSGTTANGISRNASCKETAKGFGCLSCETQAKECCLPLCSQYDNSLLMFQQKEPSNPNGAIDTAQKLPGPIRDRGLRFTPQSQCPNKDTSESPMDKGFMSSNEISTDVPPFEFYVRSEEGINLFVDLNSSPSDWIKSLKNEVYIYPDVQKSKSWALQLELKGLGDSNEQIKNSLLGNTVLGFQTKSGSLLGKSVPNSIMRDSDHVGVDCSDGDGSLGFLALKSISTPLEKSGYPDKRNHMVSQSCKSNPHIQNTMDLSTEWSSKGSERVDTGLEVHDTSQIKSTGHSVGRALSGPQLKSGSMYLENTETLSIGTSSVSQQTGLPPSHEVGEAILRSTGVAENSSGVCLGCSTSSSMEMQLSEAASHCEDTSNFPDLNGRVQPYPDNAIGKLQTENGGSSNYGLDKNTCGDPISACPEEPGGNNVINEAESSECSQIDNFLVRTSKRSHSSEDEGLQSKRQHRHHEDHICHSKPATRNTRNGNDLVREGFRRRSMRLVSK